MLEEYDNWHKRQKSLEPDSIPEIHCILKGKAAEILEPLMKNTQQKTNPRFLNGAQVLNFLSIIYAKLDDKPLPAELLEDVPPKDDSE